MAGIVFLRTGQLEQIRAFYVDVIGMKPWLSQPGIEILHKGSFLIGFQAKDVTDSDGLLTFVYQSREEVDKLYTRLSQRALAPPKRTEQFRIYNFFATDPDGRTIEFQVFEHELPEAPKLDWG
jgi:catechol 2,3-dioxygenase-like lactoylglutathione lyase family enzyme